MGTKNYFVHFKHLCVFLERASLVASRGMLEKDILVTLTLQRGKKLDRVAPVDNRPLNAMIRMWARNSSELTSSAIKL